METQSSREVGEADPIRHTAALEAAASDDYSTQELDGRCLTAGHEALGRELGAAQTPPEPVREPPRFALAALVGVLVSLGFAAGLLFGKGLHPVSPGPAPKAPATAVHQASLTPTPAAAERVPPRKSSRAAAALSRPQAQRRAEAGLTARASKKPRPTRRHARSSPRRPTSTVSRQVRAERRFRPVRRDIRRQPWREPAWDRYERKVLNVLDRIR